MKAIAMMGTAIALLSAMDLGLKQLVEHYPSMQVIFLRCVTSAPILAFWVLMQNRRDFRVRFPGNHLLRGGLGILMLFGIGECFRELQLADAYAIFFTAPLLITLLSGPVLGEKAGPYRLTAAAVGFMGVLIILPPGVNDQLITYGAAMGLLSVVTYAFSALLLRRMGHHDSTAAIAFWFVSLVGLGAALFAIPKWQPVQWQQHWPWIGLLAVTGSLGQLLITGAFKRASVAVLAPLDYTHMIWAVIYGYIFWGHLPGISTWIGTVVIVGSGLYIIFREQQIRKRQYAAVAESLRIDTLVPDDPIEDTQHEPVKPTVP